jgi:FkbM family methyltransferase
MRDGDRPRDAQGIIRSLGIYHRDAARIRRMDALNARLAVAGGLVFDIGAHVGDRVASFRRLGARVVAVEPQPAAMRALRLLFGRDDGVTLVPAAVGAAPGRIRLHLNTRNPTVSTVSPDLIAAAKDAPGWEGQDWDRAIEVPMVTLDALIDRHGLPDFIKIDVEGYEAEALTGLSRPVPALSFEFTTIQRDRALAALDRVGRLGDYAFNVSIGERHAFERADWTTAEVMAAFLRDAPHELNSGDVYAVRRRGGAEAGLTRAEAP